MKKECEFCKNEFVTHKPTIRFCSKKCSGKSKRIEKILKECQLKNCNNTFYAYPKSSKFLCSKKCQTEWQKINMIGENNPNYGNRKPGMFKHTEETKKIIKDKVKESWKKESRLKKHLEFFDRHRLNDGSMDWHTQEYREKISILNIKRLENNETSFSYKNCVKGFLLNTKTNKDEYYHSSWEMNKMIEFNENENIVIWTKKHGINISYFYKNMNRIYLPDFYIVFKDGSRKIEEIKGYVEDEDQLKCKIIAGKKYCRENGMTYEINYGENKNIYKHLIEWEKKLK